ncbi:MAG: hypothetical protein DWQ37_01980 [Planctomycetota bacterium]|nr:MAG: hypothetical protein DWQ37_01980 [Planctomycetota bacterium]
MKTNKVTSVEDYKIVSSFQSLRKTLLEDKFADRLEKPLAYWALPNDRRLPLAFLGRTIKDLLATPFEELSATPGIGQKKISSLVKLLSRATKDHPPAVPFGLAELSDGSKDGSKKLATVEKPRRQGTGFDPSIVSEALWSEWRQTVVEHGLGREKLGRLAPTLQALPTVIWHTPLGTYVDHTVAEIRQLKTHGEKRVRVVLEVFYLVHEMLSGAGHCDHLSMRIVPKFVLPLEDWLNTILHGGKLPSRDEVCQHLTVPLLDQIHVDAGPTIHELSEGRLGVNGAPQSVRQQAKRMGVTRARVYQLLEDCGRVMEVRWPEGQQLLAQAESRLHAEGAEQEVLALFHATRELFYPGKSQLADEENGG